MKKRGMMVLNVVYLLPIVLGMAALVSCSGDSGGCGQSSSTTTCGSGTKKVQSSDGNYECVPNTN